MNMMDINPKFKLAIVELYNPYRHGFHKSKGNQHVYGHHIINYSIDLDEFYNELPTIRSDLQYTNECSIEFLEKVKYETNVTVLSHPIIRNYENIVKHPKQYEIQLIQPITISIGNTEFDNYSAAIVKTHWISLIQRRWREIRKKRFNNMKNITNIKHREIHGKFPSECNIQFNLGIN